MATINNDGLKNKNECLANEILVNESLDIPDQQKREGFKRQINLVSAVCLLVGTVVGSGIFISPSVVATHSGSTGLLLIIWMGSGLISLLSALCYVELGTMFPSSSGSDYNFLYESFGELPAFVYGFTNVIVLRPMVFVMVTLTCSYYISTPIAIGDEYSKLIAAILIGILLVLNCISVRLGTIVLEFFTTVKVLALIMIAVTGLVRLGQGHNQNFEDPFKGSRISISQICYALYGGTWAYGGYDNLMSIAAELKNPVKDLPRAMWFGMSLVIISYIMVNVAYLTLLTPLEISSSKAVGVVFGEKVYGPMAWIIPACVASSTFGASNGGMISSSRMLNAVARKGHVPRVLSLIHSKHHTPLMSLVFFSVVSLIMLIPKSSNFATLLKYISFINSANCGASMAALLWLRYKRPDAERPFKVFIGLPVLILLCSIYFTVAPFYEYPLQSFYCLLAILSSIPLYYGFVKNKFLPKFCFHGLDWLASLLVRLNMNYPPDDHCDVYPLLSQKKIKEKNREDDHLLKQKVDEDLSKSEQAENTKI